MTELKPLPGICPYCERKWLLDSEQAVCIDIHGECIVCAAEDGMPIDMAAITTESRNRRAGEGET